MMSVIHILKDGSTIKDITGRVVRLEDAGAIYQLLHNINTGRVDLGKNKGGGRLAQTV